MRILLDLLESLVFLGFAVLLGAYVWGAIDDWRH